MPEDDSAVDSIRAFFEDPEHEDLFRHCPFRREFSRLKNFDERSRLHVLTHMLGHILDYKAGEPSHVGPDQPKPAINQDNLNDELR